jgi:hypothetical protein
VTQSDVDRLPILLVWSGLILLALVAGMFWVLPITFGMIAGSWTMLSISAGILFGHCVLNEP